MDQHSASSGVPHKRFHCMAQSGMPTIGQRVWGHIDFLQWLSRTCTPSRNRIHRFGSPHALVAPPTGYHTSSNSHFAATVWIDEPHSDSPRSTTCRALTSARHAAARLGGVVTAPVTAIIAKSTSVGFCLMRPSLRFFASLASPNSRHRLLRTTTRQIALVLEGPDVATIKTQQAWCHCNWISLFADHTKGLRNFCGQRR